MKNKKNNLVNYIFALGAFILVMFLAFNSLEKNQKTYVNNEVKDSKSLTEHDFGKTDNNIDKPLEIEYPDNSKELILSKQNSETGLNNEMENKNDKVIDIINDDGIFINKIVIAKNIDNDQQSIKYREPIDSYQTITTSHKKVVKEINYYPSFFVWTSINTENVNLKNKADEIEPVSLSLLVSCKDQEIKKIDYNITAATPRWREWAEIDLTLFEENSIAGVWNVEIINNNNQKVLESRSFQLIIPEINVPEATAELKIQP